MPSMADEKPTPVLPYAKGELSKRRGTLLGLSSLGLFVLAFLSVVIFNGSYPAVCFAQACASAGTCMAMISLIRSRACSIAGWAGVFLNLVFVLMTTAPNF